MKNEDNSFSVLAAIILAGVILACVPTANSNVILTPEASSPIAAVMATPSSDAVAKKDSPKSGTCSNERRAERKTEAKRAHVTTSPAV